MRSPVSGECNAIKDRGFGHVELTSASTLETEFDNRHYCRRFTRLTADQLFSTGERPEERLARGCAGKLPRLHGLVRVDTQIVRHFEPLVCSGRP
jgi:hypothetical protein